MELDLRDLLQMPEHIYIQELMVYVQGLPPKVMSPVSVMDAGAFGSFLGDASILYSLNEATCFQPDHRFRGEHYVSPQL